MNIDPITAPSFRGIAISAVKETLRIAIPVAIVGGTGYFGYRYWQDHPDQFKPNPKPLVEPT